MRQLRLPGKMALISVAFIVPVVWLLVVMVSDKLAVIESTRIERDGVRYATVIYPAIDLAGSGSGKPARNLMSCTGSCRHLMPNWAMNWHRLAHSQRCSRRLRRPGWCSPHLVPRPTRSWFTTA